MRRTNQRGCSPGSLRTRNSLVSIGVNVQPSSIIMHHTSIYIFINTQYEYQCLFWATNHWVILRQALVQLLQIGLVTLNSTRLGKFTALNIERCAVWHHGTSRLPSMQTNASQSWNRCVPILASDQINEGRHFKRPWSHWIWPPSRPGFPRSDLQCLSRIPKYSIAKCCKILQNKYIYIKCRQELKSSGTIYNSPKSQVHADTLLWVIKIFGQTSSCNFMSFKLDCDFASKPLNHSCLSILVSPASR